jgi:hypothetical protein
MFWGEERCIEDFVGKPEGNISFDRPRCRCEYNVKMDLQEVGWGD